MLNHPIIFADSAHFKIATYVIINNINNIVFGVMKNSD